jgi:hypothetical protein
LICAAAIPVNPATTQSDRVKVKFEVDGNEIKQKFKVMLYVDDQVIEPVMSRNRFMVPPEIKNNEWVNVRFLSGGYDLYFGAIHVSAFETAWIVGVDNKPFDKENTASEEPEPVDKKLSNIYYIHFVSKSGLDTRTVVKVYHSHAESSAYSRLKQQSALKRSVKGRQQ